VVDKTIETPPRASASAPLLIDIAQHRGDADMVIAPISLDDALGKKLLVRSLDTSSARVPMHVYSFMHR
jgi:hypothetical protein